MPAVTRKRTTGLTPRQRRLDRIEDRGEAELPHPGIGGYDYPRGPYGKTGFPGSTPASRRTKTQVRPEGARGLRQLDAEQNQREWAELPSRRPGGDPRQPRARTGRETASEHRMVPHIGAPPQDAKVPVRNSVAQRWKANPDKIRPYRPAANPGKTGARLNAEAQYHPGTHVWGHPDGKPVPGMASNPDVAPVVVVQSRYVSREGAMEGYAMNRPERFAKGGVGAFIGAPKRYNRHLRGGRLTGQRYFGALADQQRIGLPSDSYGISRARGPRHRPMRFEQPQPWTANYYDVPGDAGTTAPDMIHESPGGTRRQVRARGKRRG